MRKRKWMGWILVLGVTLFVVSAGFSRMLQSTAVRRYLIARLEASFGRPVEVGRFDFSLLDGARFKAYPVSVSEDPSFGQEYFLRADSVTAGLRWSSLISGRFEFGAVSLSRPSLNLVRDATGRWNIERWLPPVAPPTLQPVDLNSSRTPYRIAPARLYRIDVDGGRINFKQGDDKSPIALLDVAGSVEQDAPGRWQINLESRLLRAGVELQDIGSLRLRGNIGGTSARLQPAELNLTWTDVSLADAMRLLRQTDYGVRGQLAVDFSARVAAAPANASPAPEPAGAQWMISGVARLQGVHGWGLPGRVTDPAVNLELDAEWHLGDLHAKIGKLQIEMPASNLHGVADVDWSQGFRPHIHLESSSLGFADVLMWYRAFRPDVSDNLNLEGTLGVDMTIGGWPLQLEEGALDSRGGRLTGSVLPSPLQIGAIHASAFHGGLAFAPTEISVLAGAPQAAAETTATTSEIPSTFALGGAVFPNGTDPYRGPPNWSFSIEGDTSRVQDWLSVSQALAQPLTTGWSAEGGLAVKLTANHRAQSTGTQWLGSVDLRDVTASLPFMNQPILLPRPHLELTKTQQILTLLATQAFGATWQGTVARKIPGGPWTFDLSADHVDVTELDRWLGPRARPGLLARVTSLGTVQANPSTVDSAAAAISAQGRLHVDEIILAPLRFEQFEGDVELVGRTIAVRNAQASFYGGKAAGKFDAQLLPDPTYDFRGRFDRVDLARLADAVPSLNDRLSGAASAVVHLSAHGIGRPNLVASIEGDGNLDVRNPEISDLDFARMISDTGPDPSPGHFVSARGHFQVGGGGIEVADFLLDDSRHHYEAEGRVDFSRVLNFQIRPLLSTGIKAQAKASPATFFVRGTVEAPELVSSSPVPKLISRGRPVR